jgi:lipoate-protein ligase A
MRQYGERWRVITDFPADGAWNMAADDALLRAVGARESPPTLRLYGWQPPCLSLGYGQKASHVDRDRLRALGWGLVRRPTGGGAILHCDELTYSVTMPLDHPLAAGGIVESYRRLSAALAAAVSAFGLQPRADRLEGAAERTVVCFETPSHYELTVEGRKLVGSAQARKHNGLLQHGTLPLHGDLARICDALAYADDEAREVARGHVRRHALTLEEALGGRQVSWEQAAEAVASGFRSALGVELQAGALTAAERARAYALAQTTYAEVPSGAGRTVRSSE